MECPGGVGRGCRGECGDEAGARVLTYDVPTPTLTAGGSRFAWSGHKVQLAVPGAHNALNAAAALEAASLAGAEPERAIAGLAGFTGAGRRFQRVGATARGGVVYEDYAHHPTELGATLCAARTLEPRRLVAVFQPHLYSRTALLAREFGEALALADVAVVLDVYPARERAEDFPGVSGLTIALAAADAAGGRPVMWLPTFADALPILRGLLVEGDLCLVMGAGDVIFLHLATKPGFSFIFTPNREKESFFTARNTTETRKAEQALRRSEQLAAAGRLAASISHEINNPLEAVTNLLFLAKSDESLSASSKSLLEIADKELQRLSHITARQLEVLSPTHGTGVHGT